ncbi:MAG TPA: CAP domain-containing protein [Blastocatellia bacterium]|nr:CAP domain-containing protein [Blastocatellia bacterium]
MNSVKFSTAPSDVTVFGYRFFLMVSYAVTFVLFAAVFSGASAHVAGQPPAAPVQEAPVQSDATRTIVEKINAIRKLAGLQPVELDEGLSRACRLHAKYLVTNRADPKVGGLGAHTELEELPGFTAEGQKAAKTSNICWGRDIAGAVDLWMAGLYHRIPFLRPNLKRIGLGYEGEVVVADVVSGVGGFNLDSIAYPADGQSNVPTELGVDAPDPLPQGAPRKAGFPITLLFPFVTKIADVEAGLSDSAGGKVEFHLSDPEHPATSFPQQSTICLIPVKPLAANTTYQVSIRAKVDGWVVRKNWSFITREAQAGK